MPHIVHVSNIHRPDDARILSRQAVSAVQAGFEVTFLSRVGAPEQHDGVQMLPVPAHVPLSRSPLRHRRQHREIVQAALELGADLYQFHDVELLDVALKLADRGHCVVFDAHEDYPRQILAGRGRPLWFRLVRRAWVQRHLRRIDRRAAGIIAATSPILGTYSNPRRVLVRNYPRFALFDTSHRRQDGQIVYVGGVSRPRGAQTMVRAMAAVSHPDARLHVMGPELESGLFDLLQQMPGADRIVWHGLAPYRDAVALMERASVGVFVAQPLRHLRESLPVKIFEYFSAGLPMVISDFPEWRATFAASGAVRFVPPDDPQALARELDDLLGHPDEARRAGLEGRRWAEERFSWEHEAERLCAFYREVLESGGASGA